MLPPSVRTQLVRDKHRAHDFADYHLNLALAAAECKDAFDEAYHMKEAAAWEQSANYAAKRLRDDE